MQIDEIRDYRGDTTGFLIWYAEDDGRHAINLYRDKPMMDKAKPEDKWVMNWPSNGERGEEFTHSFISALRQGVGMIHSFNTGKVKPEEYGK